MADETVTAVAEEKTQATGTDDTASQQQQAEESPAQSQPSEGAESTDTVDEDLAKQPFYTGLNADRQKEFNRYFTQRTQKLSAQEKELERARQFADFARSDPQGFARWAAQQVGLRVAEEQTAQAQQQRAAVDEVSQQLESLFGPDVARQLNPVLEAVAKRAVEGLIQPIKATQDSILQENAFKQSQAVLEAFTARHPDWKQHETQITALAQQFQPAKGVSEAQWLDNLYFLATKDVREAEAAKKAAERITKAANSVESPSAGVPSNRVSVAPSVAKSFDDFFEDAFEAAKQGVVWER